MAIVLLIPLILMIHHPPLRIQRQRHQAVDFFRRRRQPRLVFLLHLERQGVCVGEHDLGGERARGGHDLGYAFGGLVWLADRRRFRGGAQAEGEEEKEEEVGEGEKGGGQTIPLPRDLEPRVAETPGVVVDCFLRIHEHILLARAAGVEIRDLAYDFLALGGDGEGGGGVGGVVYAGGGVVGGVGGGGQGLGVGAGLVLALGNGGAHGGGGWGGGMLVWKGGGE